MIARLAIALAAATLAGAAPAQTGEDWRQIHTQGNMVFAIDRNSIKTVGGLRHFRIRVTQAGGKTGYFDNAADCKGLTVDTLYAEVSDQSGMLHKQAYKPGEARNRLDDEEGKLIYPYVCDQ